MVEETDVTHHDEGVSFTVKLQSGPAGDRTTVKAKLKAASAEEFTVKKPNFLEEVRDGAHEAAEIHEDVFSDEDDE